MSTLRVDNIKSRTGTTVTIPDSQNLAVTGALTVTGSQTFGTGASLSLQGENINSGTRGDVLYYDANGQIAKLLFIAERTVKFHVSSILSKLHAETRTEAVNTAHKRGILN